MNSIGDVPSMFLAGQEVNDERYQRLPGSSDGGTPARPELSWASVWDPACILQLREHKIGLCTSTYEGLRSRVGYPTNIEFTPPPT